MKTKIKILQVTLLSSILFYNQTLQANKIPEELREFNHRTYNALPLSGEADLELKKNGNLDKFLKKATPLAEKYGLEASIGFRLLHRHDTLQEGQVMVEDFGHWEMMPAVITTRESEETAKMYPASWAYDSSGLRVFEYSKDRQVKKVAKKLGTHLVFFEEMKGLLEEHKLTNVLAPAILTREYFVHFNNTQPLYEMIRPEPYASVLINRSYDELEKVKEQGGNLVRTVWPVGSNDKQHDVECVTYCHSSNDDYKWHQYTHQ